MKDSFDIILFMCENMRGEVIVIGAGPAGLFAAREISQAGYKVALLNRDVKAGGLAEYGIYFDKSKMKEGLRTQFKQILATPDITYYGNVTVGTAGDIRLDEFLDAGFDAVLVCVGAQECRNLSLPGEDLEGVYHANQLVYNYTHLPPHSLNKPALGKRAVVIGAGNVMTDVVSYLIHEEKVEKVFVVARRGPLEVKFEKKEFERIAANLVLEDLEEQFAYHAPLMHQLGQDIEKARDIFYSCLPKAEPKNSDTQFFFRFLASPSRFIGDEKGRLAGVELKRNTLVLKKGKLEALAIPETLFLEADTAVLAIGNKVHEGLGLPVIKGEYVKNPNPSFPIEGLSYEAFDPVRSLPFEGIFLGGWARKASDGLVGKARKDGINGARALLQYLENKSDNPKAGMSWLQQRLEKLSHPVVSLADLKKLEEVEQATALALGIPEYITPSNDQMFVSMGLIKENQSQ